MSKEPEDNGGKALGLLIASLIALPLVLAWIWAPRLSGRRRAWQWRATHRPAAAFALVGSAVLTGLVGRWAALSLMAGSWQVAVALVPLMWVVELPWAALLVVVRLRRFATQLEHGRIAPNRSAPARLAMRDAAFADAAEFFRNSRGALPTQSENGHPVVGVAAEPRDHRHWWERLQAPPHHRLGDFADGPFAVMPLDRNSPAHHLVIGATGSGKTTLLIRMAHAALSDGWRVAVIDMKGAEQEAQAYLSLGQRLGPLVQTKHWPGEPLDLWRGTPQDIAERVMGFIPPPAAGASEFYRARLQRGINACVIRTTASVPRSARSRKGLSLAGARAAMPASKLVACQNCLAPPLMRRSCTRLQAFTKITDQEASDMRASMMATAWETPSPWAQIWARLKVDSVMEGFLRRG